MQQPGVCPLGGAVAGFFAQFALAGGEEVFAGVGHAAGEFPGEGVTGITILADEEDVVVVDVLRVVPLTTPITTINKEKEQRKVMRQNIVPRKRQRSCPNHHSLLHPLVVDEAGDFTVAVVVVVEGGVVVVEEK